MPLVIVVVVGDDKAVAVKDDVGVGHFEDDDGDRERRCYSCNYFNFCFFL